MDAYIMTGGKSSRMGQDKNFLVYENNTLLTKCITTCASVFANVKLVAKEKGKFSSFKNEVIIDKPGIDGPLGGVIAALCDNTGDTCFLTSVDLVDLEINTINKLLSSYNNEQFLGVREGNKTQPLCGIYNSTAFPVLERLAKENEFRMRQIIKHLDHKLIDPSSTKWRNLNYPEDYEGIISHD